ncbi:MAG: hypothetical protein AAF212_11430 [Verrucomicrobiota bacterium]
MIAFTDKILCICGLAGLTVSAGWTFLSLGGVKAESVESVSNSTAKVPVDPVSAPNPISQIPDWNTPTSHDDNDPKWVYGVFTPPKIYEVDGFFSAVPPALDEERARETVDVELVEIVKKLYRFQFEGYVEEDASDPRKNLVMLADRLTGFAVRARVDREFPEEGIRILDIDITRRLNDDGLLVAVEQVRIQEMASGREIILENGIPKYEENVSIKLQSTLSGEVVEIGSNATVFELNDLTYDLVSVDLLNSLVTVRKPIDIDESDDYIIETLSVENNQEVSVSTPDSGSPLF